VGVLIGIGVIVSVGADGSLDGRDSVRVALASGTSELLPTVPTGVVQPVKTTALRIKRTNKGLTLI
jgi:hypothetical protein